RLAIVPGHARAFGPVAEVREVQLEVAARKEAHERANLIYEIGTSVRREPHHLELVAVFREAEVLRDREVEQPEGMWKMRAVDDVEIGAASDCPRGADEIAEAVDRAHRRIVERRHKERARQVRRVMLDPMDLRPRIRRRKTEGGRHRVWNRADLAVVCGAISQQPAAGPMARGEP